MLLYISNKRYDVVSSKNMEENEERLEVTNNVLDDVDKMLIKNIHSKRKEIR
ncbi:hypothetical protein OXPF_10400 [Oxobacter pfennigii]|uniref:Uncharacterized protein n=1 Tax=Oxobacter pfennigii TaxID=36849 RepID=A0A0P9AIQ5_9CLOT|nr:hypothetical protein [Oxobacter pfennigii]KPU45345.1 hypothetical protein OXPF_10400 [Oxobacter pfennigii]